MKITIKQLRYVLMIAQSGSITDAANCLMISQPTLSGAIINVEKDLGFRLFDRKGGGVVPTEEGIEFLGYARRVIEEMDNLEMRYSNVAPTKIRFNVILQHLVFAEIALTEMMTTIEDSRYSFDIQQTRSHVEILEAVHSGKSDLGVTVIDTTLEDATKKAAESQKLEYRPLFNTKPYVLISTKHPLADREEISQSELKKFPYISNTVFPEESAFEKHEKVIRLASAMNIAHYYDKLLGYSIWCNIAGQYLQNNLVAIPMKTKKRLQIGYVVPRGVSLNELQQSYVDKLREYEFIGHQAKLEAESNNAND